MVEYDSLDGLNTIRDLLREKLDDPYVLAGGNTRASWIFTDNPFSSATYPRIKLELDNHEATPMDIGSDYTNWEQIIVKIYFFTSHNFKVPLDGETFSNEQLVYKYTNIIHDTLKDSFNDLYRDGVKGFRLIKMNKPSFDPEYNRHVGSLFCRFWLFRR